MMNKLLRKFHWKRFSQETCLKYWLYFYPNNQREKTSDTLTSQLFYVRIITGFSIEKNFITFSILLNIQDQFDVPLTEDGMPLYVILASNQ